MTGVTKAGKTIGYGVIPRGEQLREVCQVCPHAVERPAAGGAAGGRGPMTGDALQKAAASADPAGSVTAAVESVSAQA
jgi:hypothetical protein